MKLSKTVSAIIIVSAFFFASSNIKSSDISSLLSIDDLAQEENDRQKGAALSSAVDDPNPWETFNQWMCFDSSQVRIEKIGVKFGDTWRSWPQAIVTTLGQELDFSPSTELNLNTKAIMTSWKELIERSHEVCFYAAFLQYLDSKRDDAPRSLWVLVDLKTETGYWRESEIRH